MMNKGTVVEYKGHELKKVGKQAWNIILNNKIVGYASNLKDAKNAVDRR